MKDNLESLFGKENLQSNKIRTWEDVEGQHTICKEDISILENGLNYCYYKIIKKLVATYKIAKLIELGYGGMVTEEEWKENGAWHIIPYKDSPNEDFELRIHYDFLQKSFISFHNKEQAEEFMSYPENVELVKQYHMI